MKVNNVFFKKWKFSYPGNVSYFKFFSVIIIMGFYRRRDSITYSWILNNYKANSCCFVLNISRSIVGSITILVMHRVPIWMKPLHKGPCNGTLLFFQINFVLFGCKSLSRLDSFKNNPILPVCSMEIFGRSTSSTVK